MKEPGSDTEIRSTSPIQMLFTAYYFANRNLEDTFFQTPRCYSLAYLA